MERTESTENHGNPDLGCSYHVHDYDDSDRSVYWYIAIHTVYSNIHTRVGEIGMQRAIGMSAASLYKTFLWEGAYYGIIASVIGAVFGYVCCIFVGAAQTDALQLVAVPVMAIVEASIISIVACLLATAIPLRSIARMSIVDSIETVE